MSLATTTGGAARDGNASVLFHDPGAFPIFVADVARACNEMTAAAASNPATAQSDVDEFGSVAAAVETFNQAWAVELVSAQAALEEMVHLLPKTSTAYHETDQDTKAAIAASGSDVSDLSPALGQTTSNPLHIDTPPTLPREQGGNE